MNGIEVDDVEICGYDGAYASFVCPKCNEEITVGVEKDDDQKEYRCKCGYVWRLKVYAYVDFELTNKTVMYNGQEISFYDAMQKQREIEHEIITALQHEYSALLGDGTDPVVVRRKITALKEIMDDFIEQTGLERRPKKESIG